MRAHLHRFILPAVCAAASLAAAPAALADAVLPPMKPGFWQNTMVMHMNMAGQPPDTDDTPTVTYSCQSAQTMADAMKHMGGDMPGCAFDIEGSGGRYTIAVGCTNPGGAPGKLTASGTMVFAGESEMRVKESSSMVSPAMSMKMSMDGDAKWVGRCPSGVMPGDFGSMVNGAFKKEGNYADMAKMPSATGN